MITKIANDDTFGAFTLIFLQGMRIFSSLKVPRFAFQKGLLSKNRTLLQHTLQKLIAF